MAVVGKTKESPHLENKSHSGDTPLHMRWTQNLLQGEWEEAGAESSGAQTYVLLRKGTTPLFHLPPENGHSQ